MNTQLDVAHTKISELDAQVLELTNEIEKKNLKLAEESSSIETCYKEMNYLRDEITDLESNSFFKKVTQFVKLKKTPDQTFTLKFFQV